MAKAIGPGRPYRKNYLATGRKIPKGWHIHHIVPKCEGGTDDAYNLIAVHPNMHTWIHEQRGDKRSSSWIGWSKLGNEAMKKRYAKGDTQTHATGDNRNEAQIAGSKSQSEKMKGRPVSMERRKRISETQKGAFTAKKIADNQGTCEHCDRTMYVAHIKQWHGDKCKEKKDVTQ